ncbi:MAG: hypothetical protein WCV73_05185 [Patescibacteria group bacterium]|jgi:hypothetical protein
MKNSELAFHRGVLISHFSRIEILINSLISQHYLKKVSFDFIINVLGNEQVTFAFRRDILKHIKNLKDNDELIHNLRKLCLIRNIFAHQMETIKEKPWIDSEPYFKNPKYPQQKNKEFSAQELYDEFMQKYPLVVKILFDYLTASGVTLSNMPDQPSNLDKHGMEIKTN